MPYELRTEGSRYCVAKKGGEVLKCYDDKGKATAYLRALWANVHESVDAFSEFSMAIAKANVKDGVMRWRSVNSDVEEDYFGERMSRELFLDFIQHIEEGEDIPEPFKSVICEKDWCGGMPYISIAHYKSGEGKKNVPGEPSNIYLDGKALKSTGILYDTPLGRAVFKSLQKDLVEKRDDKIRISIGFLDMEHSHGNVYTFTRKSLTDKCPLCAKGVGDKIYKKGYLVHLALTRVPVNPRTDLEVERAMTTKREDAESIIEDEEVLKGLDLKSQAVEEEVIVIKSEDKDEMEDCEEGDEECKKKMAEKKAEMHKSAVEPEPVAEPELVEEAQRKDVSPADKKRAEKEYGDVSYADEQNKKYPIDTEEHIRAAWNYIHQERNAAKYGDHGAAIKRKILAAWKRVVGGEPLSAEEKSLVESTEFSDTTSAPVYESAIEKSFETLKSRIAEIKSQGLTGDKALSEIQSEFNSLGEVIKAELTPPPSPEEVAVQTMETTLRSLLGEMLPQMLAQTVAPIQSKLDTLEGELRAKNVSIPTKKEETVTVQRSLQPQAVQKAIIEKAAQKAVSQFDLIARQSVGLQQ